VKKYALLFYLFFAHFKPGSDWRVYCIICLFFYVDVNVKLLQVFALLHNCV